MRKVFTITGIVLLTFALGVFSFFFYHIFFGYGVVIEEQQEISNGTFKVRVQKRPVFFMQYYYILQSSSTKSYFWQEVTAHLRDDPVPIPIGQLRFVNEQVGYFFMDDFLAVSVDAGQTWTLWKPNELGIDDVIINPDGTGTAKLWNYDYHLKHRVYSFAHTTNYGQRWNFE